MRFDPAPSDIRLPEPRAGTKYMLYVHVPFCETLCPFCTFHRVKLSQARAVRYFRALREEISRFRDEGFDFSGVYVGGGTPTVLPDELVATLELLRASYDIRQVSVEANPSDLTDRVITMLEAAGVNRLSVGVQSFDDEQLRAMGRRDAYGSSSEIIDHLKAARGRFDTVNADMMFNLPRQTLSSLEKDLRILLEDIDVDQVSYYPLMSTPGTREIMARTMGEVSDRHEKPFYAFILETMRGRYRPASAWCFSRDDGMIDEYIVDNDHYLGAGSGAFSYLNGVMYSSTFSIDRYIDVVSRGRAALARRRSLGLTEQMRYDFLMKFFGLVVDKGELEAKYAGQFRRRLWKELLAFRIVGAIDDEGSRYRLTEKGMYYWLVMMREFFTGVNRLRDELRIDLKNERADADGTAARAQLPLE